MRVGLPRRCYLTRGEIVGADVGVSKGDIRKAVACGVLKRHLFPGRTRRGKYDRDELIEVFKLKEDDE